MYSTLPALAAEMAWISDGDEKFDPNFSGVNGVLTRARLARFLCQFGDDRDVRDLLALDLLLTMAGLPLSSTGAAESIPMPSLVLRPFRLWEYTWLYKCAGLSRGGMKVLDLGGPATHLSILSAMAGCQVTTLDVNPDFVKAAETCTAILNLGANLRPTVGDMRDLSRFPDGAFDVVLSCSVLEHLTASGQESAMREASRVLRLGGIAAISFDYGTGAPGVNEYLPPPHEPPPTATEAVRRYSQRGLRLAGNEFLEDPLPGCLFRDEVVRYTVAVLCFCNGEEVNIPKPEPESSGSALGGMTLRELPLRLYSGLSRVRNELFRVPLLEQGLAATEAARVQLERDFARTAADIRRMEVEGPLSYLARRYAKWKQQRGTRLG